MLYSGPFADVLLSCSGLKFLYESEKKGEVVLVTAGKGAAVCRCRLDRAAGDGELFVPELLCRLPAACGVKNAFVGGDTLYLAAEADDHVGQTYAECYTVGPPRLLCRGGSGVWVGAFGGLYVV